jgi:hypothetical protein
MLVGVCRVLILALGIAWSVPAVAGPANEPETYPGCQKPGVGAQRQVEVHTPADLAQAIRTARPGETIALGDGDYGEVKVVGDPGGFVTLTAASDAQPLITSLRVGGSAPTAHWIVRGLTLSGPVDGALDGHGWTQHPAKVRIDDAADIIIEDDRIETAPGDYPWRPEVAGVVEDPPLASGVLVLNSHCVSVLRNQLHNVFNGVGLDGDQVGLRGKSFLVKDNTIDQFDGDGIDISASSVDIEHNLITNGHDTCKDQCVHNDGIQGWTYHNDPNITNTDVKIIGNTIILKTTPALPMEADDLHGITIFDGHWNGVEVVNNIVITDAWHGITLFGVTNGQIINNTVASVAEGRKTWIDVSPSKAAFGGENSDRVVVRNNITPQLVIDRRGRGPSQLSIDHNLVDADPRRLFVKFDPAKGQFDAHLRPNAPAQGKGAADLAPPTDADGHARSGAIDLGAYVGAP